MKDFAIIGGGIGGSSMAALLHHHGYDITLLEKEPYLGGCSSTFTHKNYRFNAGATTFAGYDEGRPVKALFDTVNVTPELIETNPALVVMQQGKTIRRYRDVDRFIQELNQVHFHPENHAFWHLIASLCRTFYQHNDYYYSNASWIRKGVSLLSFTSLLMDFRPYVMVDAKTFITSYLQGISPDYLRFIDAQLMIVSQATSAHVNFLTAALALGYTFERTYYAVGGMGALCDALTQRVPDLRTRDKVEKIHRHRGHFEITSSQGTLKAKQIILNTTLYDSHRFFEDRAITHYYDTYKPLNNGQSAFVVYMILKSSQTFEHHYQILLEAPIERTMSHALFVSFSDASDTQLAPNGYYSVTASIHTDLRWWDRTHKPEYTTQKQRLQDQLVQLICATLPIHKEEIVMAFSATPMTFQRYIGRSQLGGNAMTRRNVLFKLPSNDTPISGLYHIGDTSYAAQGWPGILMGVHNLAKLLHV